MKREFSLYLDLMRFLAAVLVVINHSNHRDLIAEVLPQLGHSAVMVFFVLSGYVIAYVAATRETQPRDYAVSRLARIYSVAPVAILATVLLDLAGQSISMAFYEGSAATDHYLLRSATSLVFMNEIWHVSITTFSNVPYWSLNYEVWYYILFGLAVYLRGWQRLLSIAAACLLLGPKVLLLAPIWWAGVYLFHSRRFAAIGELTGWILFVGSLVAVVLFHEWGVRELFKAWLQAQIGEPLFVQLAYSKSFLSDYVLGVIVFLNFAGFRAVSHRFAAVLLPLAKPIRYLAGYTFILYLIHQPLIWFFATLINGDPSTPLFYAQVMLCVVVSVWLLGQITEKRKDLYRRWSEGLIDAVLWLLRVLSGRKGKQNA